MRKTSVVVVFLLCLSFIGSALAKTPEERIGDLENQLNSLQKTYMSNNQNVASAIAGAQAVKEEWSVLKGQVDANSHLISSQRDSLMKQIGDLDHRIQAIEDRMAIFASQLSNALGKVAPEAAAEGDLYQKGLDLVNQAKYLEAASTFEQFLQSYGKSQFAPSAKMWIGECFYSMRDYQRAIQEYQNFIEKYPRDPNVGTSILKQGNSFLELGLVEEAKAFYQKVIQSYPSSEAASVAQSKLERIKERDQKSREAEGANSSGSYPGETLQQRQQRLKGEVPPTDKNSKPPSSARPKQNF